MQCIAVQGSRRRRIITITAVWHKQHLPDISPQERRSMKMCRGRKMARPPCPPFVRSMWVVVVHPLPSDKSWGRPKISREVCWPP